MKRAPNQPTTEIAIYAGIYVKTHTVADAGTLLPQHSHEWPHLSLIVSGAVYVWRGNDALGRFDAPAMVKVEAQQLHKFLALTDGVVICCIHNADHIDADGEPAIRELAHLELED